MSQILPPQNETAVNNPFEIIEKTILENLEKLNVTEATNANQPLSKEKLTEKNRLSFSNRFSASDNSTESQRIVVGS